MEKKIEKTMYKGVVNFGLSLQEAIKAGKYRESHGRREWLDRKTDPVIKETSFELLQFPEKVSCEDAVEWMKADGLRPAGLEETLAFGAAFPDVQEYWVVIGLGTAGDRSGFMLRTSCFGRYFGGVSKEEGFGTNCGFLAVRD